ncbi:hypothetical protein NECAME_10863 [Necator americanus]|uniref:Pyrroline-5-carboxylate reductase dimerisation domain-containing protein n=1 Tax=Necator americanus TaxID=51031 RepID=W2T792_NECAM|nr:hypothetical protein NECAME_10863 [Necator americanus]ETN77738.1 hypothetical protein NECAME_10863 [Necator americanus]
MRFSQKFLFLGHCIANITWLRPITALQPHSRWFKIAPTVRAKTLSVTICTGNPNLMNLIQMKNNSTHPAQLKDDVQSPGGSSVYGMHKLETGGLKGVSYYLTNEYDLRL